MIANAAQHVPESTIGRIPQPSLSIYLRVFLVASSNKHDSRSNIDIQYRS
jgi:hypothetical protein